MKKCPRNFSKSLFEPFRITVPYDARTQNFGYYKSYLYWVLVKSFCNKNPKMKNIFLLIVTLVSITSADKCPESIETISAFEPSQVKIINSNFQ